MAQAKKKKKKKKKKTGSDVGTAGKVFVLLLMVVLVVVMCQDDGNNRSTRPDIGEEGVLWVGDGTSSVYVAPTKKYCERVEQLIYARDDMGLSDMLRSGQVWAIPSGTRCRVIYMSTTYEVRILEGDQKGKSGFVWSKFIRKP